MRIGLTCDSKGRLPGQCFAYRRPHSSPAASATRLTTRVGTFSPNGSCGSGNVSDDDGPRGWDTSGFIASLMSCSSQGREMYGLLRPLLLRVAAAPSADRGDGDCSVSGRLPVGVNDVDDDGPNDVDTVRLLTTAWAGVTGAAVVAVPLASPSLAAAAAAASPVGSSLVVDAVMLFRFCVALPPGVVAPPCDCGTSGTSAAAAYDASDDDNDGDAGATGTAASALEGDGAGTGDGLDAGIAAGCGAADSAGGAGAGAGACPGVTLLIGGDVACAAAVGGGGDGAATGARRDGFGGVPMPRCDTPAGAGGGAFAGTGGADATSAPVPDVCRRTWPGPCGAGGAIAVAAVGAEEVSVTLAGSRCASMSVGVARGG